MCVFCWGSSEDGDVRIKRWNAAVCARFDIFYFSSALDLFPLAFFASLKWNAHRSIICFTHPRCSAELQSISDWCAVSQETAQGVTMQTGAGCTNERKSTSSELPLIGWVSLSLLLWSVRTDWHFIWWVLGNSDYRLFCMCLCYMDNK